jgi:hypothetical protein
LQQYFNKHIFKLEQAEYASEGILWSAVSFVDNQECLDLIAKKPTGLLPLLDEECSFPGADDNSLFQKFNRQHKSHPHYHTPQLRHRNPVFTIVHYASDVSYSVQGFRTKNRDLMRQDIIDVLRTSHMDLVRALIGLPPYAVHRWHMAYHKVVSTFAFKKAGAVHKLKKEGRLTPSFQDRYLRAATPPISFDHHDGPSRFVQSHTYAGNLADALAVDSGRLNVSRLGMRASRSYNTLSEVAEQESMKTSTRDDGTFQAYGLSPKAHRRPTDLPPANRPDSPNFYISSSPDYPLRRQGSLDHEPHSPSPLLYDHLPPAKPVVPVFTTSSSTITQAPRQPDIATTSKQAPIQEKRTPEPVSSVTQTKAPSRRMSREKRPFHKMDSRNRLPSISQLQEKLRKRWPRTLRVPGSAGETVKEKNAKYWKTAPRLRDTDEVDARMLHTLARTASKRHHGLSKTVSGQFQSSLLALMETLERTNPHFVRCIKSNNCKAPCQFDDDLVLRQLRYTGMVQTVKIRKAGYSVRMTFEDFYEKYQFLIGVKSSDLASQIDLFLKGMDFTPEHFQVGSTKVFMRESQKYALEEELREKVLARIVVIQRWVRAKLLRCRFLHIRRSVTVLQSAVRGWRTRIKVDEMRLRVCKAVEIQAAWRGFMARKQLIQLKQATIILQAHWRGKCDRRRYVVLCEEKRREKEERQRQEEEMRRKEEEARRQEEERKENETKNINLESLEGTREGVKPVSDQQQLDPRKRDEDGVFLDAEVSDVLFHFDTIVTELEKTTLESGTPRSLTPNDPEIMRTPTPGQSRELVTPDILVQRTTSDMQATEGEGEGGEITRETPPKSVQPMFKVRNIKQQYLQKAQRDSAPSINLRSPEVPSSRGNVRSIIAQMQASSRENSTSPAPEDEESEPPARRGRVRASSISQRISMLTQLSTDTEVFERKEEPVVSSGRISELAHGFESKKQKSPSNDSRPRGEPSRKKRRSSSVTKDDAPRILSPPISSSQVRRRSNSQDNGVLSLKKASGLQPVKVQQEDYTRREIEEALREIEPSSKDEQTSKLDSGDTTQPIEQGSDDITSRSDDSTSQPICLPPVTSRPTLKIDPEENSRSGAIQSASQSDLTSPGSEGNVFRTESTSSSELLQTPPVEQAHRFRSISDVSHNTRKLVSYQTEVAISSSKFDSDPPDQVTELHGVPLKQHRKLKRSVVSIADPTDIITNLQLAHIPLEGSSELTQGLGIEEVHRLNQKPERIRSPVDRLKLFSFSKRHLRLPFSRGKGKKEKHVKLAVSPEKTSPKRRGSKHETRNKRLSRAQADQLFSHNFVPIPIIKGVLCGVCHKGFTGFMRQCQTCAGCGVVVHKHCEYRSPPCKAQIESGSYVTMSRKKIVKALDDLDDLAQFLLHKISMLNKDRSANSKLDQVFESALFELHNSLVSNYSLTLQKSLESSDQTQDTQSNPPAPQPTEVERRVTITFAQLVNNFTNIFKGIAKRQGLSDPGYLAISTNQMKSFLDEFSKGRRHSMAKAMSGNIEPATLRRKTVSGHGLELVDHNGHSFFTEQFKVAAVCEYCNDPIPLLEKGEVCLVCGYTCHLTCLKLTSRKCEGKDRAKTPPASNKPETTQSKNQFGVPLESLVPTGSKQVPTVLEKCLQYIEDHGLYIQGIYRKSPGASSKRAVKAALEEDPAGCSLEGFHVNAVAAAVGAFFRELPTPLIPNDRYTDLLRTIDLTDRDERLEALHHLLGRLPELNHAVFERLVFHLARVAQQEPTNRMSPYNLAVIFAPCLFQGETKSKNPQDLLKELAKQTIVLELIIEEQVEKLEATLRGIETLSVVARDTASKLTELIGSEESPSTTPSTEVSGGGVASLRAGRPALIPSHEGGKMREEDEQERQRLTSELQEIERERVELTVNLPKLEPFTRDHHASWVFDSGENSPTPELQDTSLPPLPSHSLLPALTKNRVSQKPKSRRPTRRTLVKGEHDESDIEISQL